MEEGITFEGVSNPRVGLGWGPVKCDACGCDSSGFVLITIASPELRCEECDFDGTISIVLCKGCLNKGEKLIDEAILSQVR